MRVELRSLARWDADSTAMESEGARVRGAYIVDAGNYSVAVGDCSGAGSAIGLVDAVECHQQHTHFMVRENIVF